MTSVYQQLAERIQGELPELERVKERALRGWSLVQEHPEEDMYLDAVALNLHGFYSGLERIFELIARRVDGETPTGSTWHRDLLHQMAQDQPRIRPAVIGQDRVLALDELRRFRHLVRNVYSMNLSAEKMVRLLVSLQEQWPSLYAELAAFAEFLASVGDETNSGETNKG